MRGLDYYNDTVFEFEYNENNQKFAILGGGRYDKLVSKLSDKDVAGFGFGLGIERFIIALQETHPEFVQALKNELREGDVVLVKGSRSSSMEKILTLFEKS